MTGQIPDRVVYRGYLHSLVGVRGDGLFRLADIGMAEPTPLSTACWRGFQATYVVHEDHLILAHLDVGLKTDPETGEIGTPLVFGTPCKMTSDGEPTGEYRRIDQPIAFDGRLLVAREFIRELYVHMGFQPPHAYGEVHELTFDHGRLAAARDVSPVMADVRRALGGGTDRPEPEEDLTAWIARRFDLDFRWDQWEGPGG